MDVPFSESTVVVQIIDTTTHIVTENEFAQNPIKGNELLDCPSLAFLIKHPSGRQLLFDLGLRKDFTKLPPVIQQYFERQQPKLSVEKDVRDVLEENGVDVQGIEAIVCSHWHYDHMGDPSRFEPSTALVVGPGFTSAFVPGYPENPGSPILETDYSSRELREINFQGDNAIKIGDFDAIDYFGDGSFYILDAPGHTVGHICALARTTTSPASFILMGADSCHHSGELRPSEHRPLPSEIHPHPLQHAAQPCPGALFEHLLRKGNKALPFYEQKRPGLLFSDPDVAEKTIEKLQLADSQDNIFVVIAHDAHLRGIVDFFPRSANDFMAKGWHNQTRWSFLSDFKFALLEGTNLLEPENMV